MATIIDPAIHTAGLAGLEAGINRALSLAPEGRAELAKLDNCVFALRCTAPEIEVYLQTCEQGVRLMGIYEGEITTSVRGDSSDFAELATSDDPTATLINGKLELEGNSAALIELQKILGNIDIDWEAPLIDTLGDVAGHQLAQALRAAFSWGKQAGSSMTRQISEFIHEEGRLSPPRLELEDFYRDVQELSMRVERLASRTARLRKQLHQHRE